MKKTGKIFIILSLAALAAWIIPWLYNLATVQGYRSPFTLYSSVVHDFTTIVASESKSITFEDTAGNRYDETVQPLFYSSILIAHGTMPDSLEGRPITREAIDSNSAMLSLSPDEVNRKTPPVHLLMESVPPILNLEDPEDAFISRKDGLHVYHMETNEELPEKSAAFTEALRKEGFVFPVALTAANPTDHKPYDEGYLLTDKAGHLFHLKQVDGAPFAERIAAADALDIREILITEFKDRRTLGLVMTTDGKLNFLTAEGEIIPTDVPYNPMEDDFLLIRDIFYYTLKVSDDKGDNYYALRTDDFSLVKELHRPRPTHWRMPRLAFTSSKDRYVKPRFRR